MSLGEGQGYSPPFAATSGRISHVEATRSHGRPLAIVPELSRYLPIGSPRIMPPITWLYSRVRRSGRTRYSLSSALEGWARCIALAIYA